MPIEKKARQTGESSFLPCKKTRAAGNCRVRMACSRIQRCTPWSVILYRTWWVFYSPHTAVDCGILRVRVYVLPNERQAYEQDTLLSTGNKTCLELFDLKSYLIMAFMMSGGIWLRNSGLAPEVFIAVFYTGLGCALGSAGILFWVNFIKGLVPQGHTE